MMLRRLLLSTFLLLSIGSCGCAHQEQQASLHIQNDDETKSAAPSVAEKEPDKIQRSELFAGIPLSDIAAAQAEVKRHVLPHWPKIAERSRYVRERLVATLRDIDAPLGLQAIPVIESGYNPYALSYAGAMGLWQLMPRTAKGLGVNSDGGLNGRRNVEISTRAAASYLVSMKERFGNWPLAFAAYHLGPTAVNRRIRRSPWSPEDGLRRMPVPSVTRAYVRHVIGFAALLYMKSLSFPEAFPAKPLKLTPPVDLKELTASSRMEQKELFLFNPGLDHAQYLSEEITLYIPDEHFDAMQARSKEIAPRYIRVAIHSGDSLWSLARRHHTSVQHLRRLNPGLGSLLTIGKTLKVPANQLARARPSPNPLLSQGRRIRYKVRSGDSLWSIAQRFGTTPGHIARSNQISMRQLIRPGDTLWIVARIRPI